MQGARRLTVLVATLVLVLTGWCSAVEDKPGNRGEAGFKAMFDLPKFSIYNGTSNRWAFTGDGIIIAQGAGGGWLMHPKEFGDLELRLEYKMTKGEIAASPCVARASPPRASASRRRNRGPSYEIQLVDDANNPLGKDPLTCTGAIYGIAPALKQNVNRPLGAWNDLRIVARGTKVTVTLNGEKVQDVDLKKYAHKVKGKVPHFLDTKGHVGLQSWEGRVEFRNLRIKDL
jgi:hypothetical protein